MDRSKDGAARRLAEAHFRVEPEIAQIFRLLAPDGAVEASDAEPVKLLEVNPNTPKNGVVPIYFGADQSSGAFFPAVIVEIHPEELEALQRGRLQLPDGWRIGPELQRPREAAHA